MGIDQERTDRFEALRPRLFGLTNRALGSRADADDVVQERAAFLLRQLASRAKKHIREHRPRFQVGPEQHRAALEQFFGAVMSGNRTGLLSQLRQDAVAYSDGGGKAAAALNPIFCADRICRFFLGLGAKSWLGTTFRIEPAGGVPSLWLSAGGKLESSSGSTLTPTGASPQSSWCAIPTPPPDGVSMA